MSSAPHSTAENPGGPATSSRLGLRVGDLIARRFRLEGPLPAGAMAEVWEATDTVLDRRVAAKFALPIETTHTTGVDTDASHDDRFEREARIAARVAHPNIVSVFDAVESPVGPVIIMELVKGRTLAAVLARRGAVDEPMVCRVGLAIADALQVVHAHQVVHRDVKPGNIFICDSGQVKLADFGIATAKFLPDESVMLGTAGYVSPEQLHGHNPDGSAVGAQSDIYSLAVVMYEMLTARLPFDASDDRELALQRLDVAPIPLRQLNTHCDPGLSALVMKNLAIDPSARSNGAAELRAELDDIARHARRELRSDASTAATTALPIPVELAPAPTRHLIAVDGTAGVPQPAGTAQPVGTAPAAAQPSIPGTSGIPGATTRDTGGAAYVPGGAAPGTHGAPPELRSVVFPVIAMSIVLIALVVVGLLIRDDAHAGSPSDHPGESAAATALLTPAEITAFDPEGTGTPGENNGLLDNLADGDVATSWRTEGYQSRDLNGKEGVGLLIPLSRPVAIDRIEVTALEPGWRASVYVVDSTDTPIADITRTKEPAVTIESTETTTRFDLGGARGAGALVWFTRLSPSGPPFRIQIAELSVWEAVE